MRIVLPFILAVAASTAAASSALAAPPLLKGTYTLAGSQMCQAPVGKPGGDIEHQVGSASFTATATANAYTMKMLVKDQAGSAVTNTGSVSLSSLTVDGSATVSGTTNPYTLTLKTKVGGQTMTSVGLIQLDLAGAADGIARRAVIMNMSSNGEMTGKNCTTQMLLFRQ